MDKMIKRWSVEWRPEKLILLWAISKMEQEDSRWYGAALLDDNGVMIGSMAVMYGKSIEVIKCNAKRPWHFNRPQEFFEERGEI